VDAKTQIRVGGERDGEWDMVGLMASGGDHNRALTLKKPYINDEPIVCPVLLKV